MDNLLNGDGEVPRSFPSFLKSRDKVEIEMLFRVYFRSGKKRCVIRLFYEADALRDEEITNT